MSDWVKMELVFDDIPALLARVSAGTGLAVKKTLSDVEQYAKEAMHEPKSGRTYKRGGQEHQASAPGEAPAPETEELEGSFETRMTSEHEGDLTVTSEHAGFLEFGTRKMAARPFLAPAVDKAQAGFEAGIAEAVNGGIGSSGDAGGMSDV